MIAQKFRLAITPYKRPARLDDERAALLPCDFGVALSGSSDQAGRGDGGKCRKEGAAIQSSMVIGGYRRLANHATVAAPLVMVVTHG
ncbi:hypothetical protein [Sphingosinicella microcystinivorans]|uniref:Uncharacterized protein n=1 Tax=Sphingosinicella microcystinivorans TaxID=335406 RepID=A0AAD1G122_SPHMI|nr:hypothetical protein [Sphingosinicella microcystinivorans]BBE34333.1 hypothetical protein SmB9_19910 [Sphingosinicella microcystinivorans]